MTSHELSDFIGTARKVKAAIQELQQLQGRLLKAHPDSETQLLYDIQALDSNDFYWLLNDVLKSALQEAEISFKPQPPL